MEYVVVRLVVVRVASLRAHTITAVRTSSRRENKTLNYGCCWTMDATTSKANYSENSQQCRAVAYAAGGADSTA